NLDLLGFQPGDLCRGGAIPGLELSAGPDLAAVRPHIGDAVERLHRSVGQVGQLINGFEFLGRLVYRGGRVAFLPGHGPRLFSEFGILLALRSAIELRERTLVPDDLQRLAAEFGGPKTIGHYRDPAIDLDHVSHTRRRLRLVSVKALHLPAKDRWALDDSGEHTRQVDIETENGLAVDLLGGVQPLRRLADEFEILGIF